MEIPGWEKEGNKLAREFEFADFKAALDFVNKVGILAEKTQHHPDIHIFYSKVKLELSTHDAGGVVTDKDYSMAKDVNKLYA